jgi:Tol biopolymer transport system component
LSADGRTLAYFWHATSVEKIRLQKLGSDLRRQGPPVVLNIPGLEKSNCRAPAWLRASGRLAFLSNPAGYWQIWTIQLRDGQARDLRLSQASGADIVFPSYTRDGRTLIYTSRTENTDTWRIDRSPNGAAFSAPRRIQNSNRQERHPQISPDGRHIVFESDRSGLPEIWVSDLEGSNAFQLTHFSGPFSGSPNWSPDSRIVVFDSRVNQHSAIFRIDALPGARPQQLTDASADDRMPCFSADGQWVYFNSRRSGSGYFTIWRISSIGGTPEMFLDQQEFDPAASSDGKFLYVIGGPNSNKVLRRVNMVDHSVENLAMGVMDRSAAVTDDGVYTLVPKGADRFDLLFVPQHSPKQTRVSATLTGKLREGLSATRDGASLVFTRQEQRESDLMVVRNIK